MPDFNRGRTQNPRQGGPQRGGNAQNGVGGGAPRAAVPWYVGTDFTQAPPGHRYLLYLPFWKKDWGAIKEGKQRVLKDLGALPDHAGRAMLALAQRQRAIGKANGAEVIEAVSTSPFATGLGWEHPNENGFAFLHPYGLPYLAGSGMKGVLRRAAEELALLEEDARGWNPAAVWLLFGFEAGSAVFADGNPFRDAYERWCSRALSTETDSVVLSAFQKMVAPKFGGTLDQFLDKLEDKVYRQSLHTAGALRFFDSIPEIDGNCMGIDIMNPHYGEYYQGNSTPHDAGKPVPIFFLVVPPGSRFTFVVDCPREHHLPANLKGKWRDLIRVTFAHAFDWLGFGAKTAVGYGQFRTNDTSAAATAYENPLVVEEHSALPARLKEIKNSQTFNDFVKSIKQDEIDMLKSLSLKGMESVINIGSVADLESAEASSEIKRIIAERMLDIISPNKKWDEKKHEKYRKLLSIAGRIS